MKTRASLKKNTKSPKVEPKRSPVLLLVLFLGVAMIYLRENQIFPFSSDITDMSSSSDEETAKSPSSLAKDTADKNQKNIFEADTRAKRNDKTTKSNSDALDRARALVDRGEAQAAAEYLEEAMKARPDDAGLLMELGILSILDLKNPEKAKAIFEKIIALDASHRSALNELVMLYGDTQFYSGGVEFLQSAIATAEDPSELEYALGRLYSQNGHAAEAIEHLEKSKGLADIQDQVLIDLAEASAGANNTEKAVDSYRKAIKVQTDELEKAMKENLGGIDFIEDRVFNTKLSLARTFIAAHKQAEALKVLNDLIGHENDPTVIALKQEANVRF